MSETTGADVKRPARWSRRRLRRRLPNILILLLLTLVAIVSLFPLYWLFATALTPASATIRAS